MSAPSPFGTDPFHPLGSIHVSWQFLHLYYSVLIISLMWYVQVCSRNKHINHCTCPLAETLKQRLRVVIYVLSCCIRCVLVHIGTIRCITHAHLLNKRNSSSSPILLFNFICVQSKDFYLKF